MLWNNNDAMFALYNSFIIHTLNVFPCKCPVCGNKSAHIYFNRYDDVKGGFWSWCSSCGAYVHSFGKVPYLWKNCSNIKADCLTAVPDYLEKNKAVIDDWIESLQR